MVGHSPSTQVTEGVVLSPSINEQDHNFWKYLGENITNNQAEYGGLILGLEKAIELGSTNIRIGTLLFGKRN